VDNKPRPTACHFAVQLKAFGDFVIALWTIRRVRGLTPNSAPLQLLAGQHLRDLASALGVERDVLFVPSGHGLPAAFDFRRRGVLQGVASLLRLRASLRGLPRGCRLIFDEVFWRENFIAAPYARNPLLSAPNVYIAFTETLRLLGFDIPQVPAAASLPLPRRPLQGLVRLFPSSRNEDKCIPAAVTARLVDQLSQAGMRCEVIELAGEGVKLPAGLPVRHLERNFGSLIEAVSGSDLVVTADSLPGHLAEYFGLPAYVISPRPNAYWLPLSCFVDNAWSLFHDEQSLPKWLSERTGSG
jgi:ADP-heptose:LPS heptosyltransferase